MKTVLASASLLFLAIIPVISQEVTRQTIATPPNERFVVYAKIVLPGKAPAEGKESVESWIRNKLKTLGEPTIRAVTGWVRLPGGEERSATIWNGVMDGKGAGCIVDGHVGKVAADGNVRVTLSGWAPILPKIKGASLLAEVGCRQIAVVDTGRADGAKSYVALMIAPVPQAAAVGEQNGGRQTPPAPESKAGN